MSSIIKGVTIFLRTFLLFPRHHSRYKEVQSDLEHEKKSLIGRRVNVSSFLANERSECRHKMFGAAAFRAAFFVDFQRHFSVKTCSFADFSIAQLNNRFQSAD